MKPFIDITEARAFIEQAMIHYTARKAPSWFTDWLDDLYIRLGENLASVTCEELVILSRLYGVYEEDSWMVQPLAVNTVYKMFDRMGRDTTGMLGY